MEACHHNPVTPAAVKMILEFFILRWSIWYHCQDLQKLNATLQNEHRYYVPWEINICPSSRRYSVIGLLQGGKLDLTEVEGIADLLAAETSAQHRQVGLESMPFLSHINNTFPLAKFKWHRDWSSHDKGIRLQDLTAHRLLYVNPTRIGFYEARFKVDRDW